MARPRSEEKRTAILVAAARAIAAQGIGAPTSRIANEAGVAEGTLFTYFDNKDALLNQLYLHVKANVRAAMMDGFPRSGSAKERVRHAWNGYVAWGVANPQAFRALRHLSAPGHIDAKHLAAGAEGFSEISALLREKVAGGALPAKEALAFAATLFNTMAEATMDYIANHPSRAGAYRNAGFEAFWAALNASGK